MWIASESMRLKYGQWRASFLQTTITEEHYSICNKVDTNLGRYIKGLQFYRNEDNCIITIIPVKPQDGIGCRMIGTTFYQLVLQYGGVENLPNTLYFQAGNSKFQTRSLLTLAYLCGAETRQNLYERFSYHHIPPKESESANAYESRVINEISSQFSNYERLNTNELKLKKVQSTPDGLLLNWTTRQLVIVEAKKHRRDFADGAAQLVQYYAQARNHDRFKNLEVCCCLITDACETTEAYGIWRELMTSQKDLKIRVKASNTEDILP